MVHKLSSTPIVIVAIISICMIDSLHAAGSRPPAGQMCTEGSYVTGFDSEGNIICSVPGGASLPVTVETAEQANSQDEDGCPAGCLNGTTDTGAADSVEADDKLVQSKSTVVDVENPVITDVKPSWIVFGARETSIAIIGTGFTDESVVKFQDSTYSPSVNPSGTELRVNIATRNLPIGRYAITVSNGPGQETIQRRALEVY
jgi:hypothetical protein